MKRICCTAQFVAALALVATVSACGTVEIFSTYDLPESETVADAPWPRLVDTPTAPPPGEFSAQVPDPAVGERIQVDMAAAAVAAEARAKALAGPVIPAADRARIDRAVERKQ
ncbi:MAG: hypothetical protein AAF557_26675 [Pseudomonadota bacterium]